MKECKFKVGDKVNYISDNPSGDYYEHNVTYTIKKLIRDHKERDWLVETLEVDTGARWQWKFELAKNKIVRDIINDL